MSKLKKIISQVEVFPETDIFDPDLGMIYKNAYEISFLLSSIDIFFEYLSFIGYSQEQLESFFPNICHISDILFLNQYYLTGADCVSRIAASAKLVSLPYHYRAEFAYMYGVCCLFGIGVPRNDASAVDWFQFSTLLSSFPPNDVEMWQSFLKAL